MRRALAIAAAALLSFSHARAAGVSLQAEYRRDAVDYDETVSEFYRYRTGLDFSDESSFNAAVVHSAGGRGESHTWNLALNDASPFFRIMLGNYFARFGGGLILGKRSPFNPDDLSRRAGSAERKTFTPVKSGNPLYAFNGIALSAGGGENVPGFTVNALWSSALRFLDAEGYFSGCTDAGLETLSASERTNRKTEPVYLKNFGLNCAAVCEQNFLVEASLLSTLVEKPQGGHLRWDDNSGGPGKAGTRGVTNLELLMEYRESPIRLFLEPALSTVTRERSGGAERRIGGYAYMAGMTLKSPFLEASLTRKYTGPDYYAPYSAAIGEHYPERAWFFDIALPRGVITAGASLSSEKKLRPDAGDDDLTLTTKEEVFLRARGSFVDEAGLSFRIMTRSADGTVSRKRQIASRVKMDICGWLSTGTGAVYQARSGSGGSMLASGSLSISHGKGAITAAYCRAHVAGGNPLYAVIAPAENASIPGAMLRQDAQILVARISLSASEARFNFRSFHMFTDGARTRHTMEISGQAFF